MHADCHSLQTAGDLLCQSNPLESTGDTYPDTCATDSIFGYLNCGMKQVSCIIEANRLTKREFQWFVTISCEDVLSIAAHNEQWLSFTNRTRRYYKQGLALVWTREITPSDPRKLHYHLGVLEGFSNNQAWVRQIFEKCLVRFARHHLWVEPAHHPRSIPFYLFKQREWHRDKILLFKPNLNLKKFGFLGAFWPKGVTKRQLESRIRVRERSIADGASKGFNPVVIRHVSNFTQRPYKEIRRLVGEDPHDPVWESWLGSMGSDTGLVDRLNEADREYRRSRAPVSEAMEMKA
jgi:hypothetical protein